MSHPRKIAPNRVVVGRSLAQLAGGLDNHAAHLEGQRKAILQLEEALRAVAEHTACSYVITVQRSFLGRLRWLLTGR